MYTSAIRNKNNNLSNYVTAFMGFLLLLISSVALVGCNSSGSSTPPPATDASGLYTDGTATIDGTAVTDLTAIIYNDRLMMFTNTLNVLYDGTIAENADGSFTSIVDIYILGVKEAATANITGNISNRSQVTGTIGGTGVANATFTLVFNDLYDRDATLPRIVTDGVDPLWLGTGSTTNPQLRLEMDFLSTNLLNMEVSGTDVLANCTSENGSFTIAPQKNIFTITIDLLNNIVTCNIPGTNFTGLVTVIDSDPLTPNTDDVLIMAMSNGTNSIFGTINK
jgi:hypothetical protein